MVADPDDPTADNDDNHDDDHADNDDHNHDDHDHYNNDDDDTHDNDHNHANDDDHHHHDARDDDDLPDYPVRTRPDPDSGAAEPVSGSVARSMLSRLRQPTAARRR